MAGVVNQASIVSFHRIRPTAVRPLIFSGAFMEPEGRRDTNITAKH
jgi:hypothetical protein